MRLVRSLWKVAWTFAPGSSGSDRVSACDGEGLSYEQKLEKLTRIYQRKKLRLALTHIALAGGYLVAMLFLTGGLKAGLIGLSEHFSWSPETALVVLYTFCFFLLYRLVSFPLHYLSDFKLEHDFMLSTETFGRWLAREAKVFALSQAAIVVFVAAFYYFLRAAGDRWWIFATLAYVLFAVVIGRLFPVVIVPLFYKRSPLKHGAVVARVKALADRARFNVSQVFDFDLSKETRKATAALVGIGRSRQILISDTLLSHFTVDEIEAVCAHELGHHVHQHYLRLFAVGCVVAMAAFYLAQVILSVACPRLGFAEPADIATLPLFCLVLAGFAFVVRPLLYWYSRRLEVESDDYAVRMTSVPGAFSSALEKLARMNLQQKRPGRLAEFLFYDHPPIARRCARARRLEQELARAQEREETHTTP